MAGGDKVEISRSWRVESCESRGYQRKYECGVRLNARFTEVYRTICCVRRGDIDLKYGLVNKKVAMEASRHIMGEPLKKRLQSFCSLAKRTRRLKQTYDVLQRLQLTYVAWKSVYTAQIKLCWLVWARVTCTLQEYSDLCTKTWEILPNITHCIAESIVHVHSTHILHALSSIFCFHDMSSTI